MAGTTPKTIGTYVWLCSAENLPDGGTPDGGTEPSSTSGCSCRVATPADYDTAFFLAIAVVLGWPRRRRAS